jgi:hypothetical protein
MFSRSCASPLFSRRLRAAFAVSTAVLVSQLSGCAVVTVAGAAVGVAATGVGLAADAAVGTVKLVGSGVSAVLPSSDPAK